METCGVYVFGSSERELSKVEVLRGIISEKMTVAVHEILAVVERTVVGYEKEVSLLRRELTLKKTQLDAILQPRVYLKRIDFDDGTSELSNVSSESKNITKERDNKTSTKSMGVNRFLGKPSTVFHEETLLDQEESDFTFSNLPSDSSVSCPAGREKCPRDNKENNPQNTKAKRRRRLPKRYRSNDNETDSDREKNRQKEGKERQRSSNVNVKRLIKLRVSLLEKCPDMNISNDGKKYQNFRLKVPDQTIVCQKNLSESDFFDRLRSTFAELGEDTTLEAVLLDRNKRLVPHLANKMTQTELYNTFRKAETHIAFCIYPKELEDMCETPTTSHDHKPSTSGPEQLWSETGSPSESTNEQDGMFTIAFVDQMEDDGDGEDDDEWKPEQNDDKYCDSPKSKKIRTKRAQMLTAASCKVCGLSFKYKKILTKHALCHLANPKSICGVCGEELRTSEELKSHLETHQKLHQCEKCGQYFLTYLVLQRHLATCQLGKTASAVKILSGKKGKPRHQCDSCPLSFRSAVQLNYHKCIHTGKKPYCCDICGKSLSDCSSLHRHKMIHTGEKKHGCKFCKRHFYSRYRLKEHQLVHFEREKNFLCEICSKTFYTKSSLMMHQKTHDASHIVKCPVCDKLLKGELEKHMKVHTGEKPYSCKTCGVRFRLRSNLRTHVNAHLGIKPYICSVCGYRCSRNEHLRVHMNTHTGHKPYKCTLCDKAYTQGHCLKTHMKSHQTEQSTIDPH